jgi:hypothetical protein
LKVSNLRELVGGGGGYVVDGVDTKLGACHITPTFLDRKNMEMEKEAVTRI